METILTTVLVSLVSSLVAGAGVGGAVYFIFKKRLVEPVKVYEKPAKKTTLITGSGVYVVEKKKPCRVNDDQKAFEKERDEAYARWSRDPDANP